jgi:two-component system, LytTR family, response regulator LytT
MKVLVIEDEQIAASRLVEMLRDLDRDIEVVKVLDSVESSIEFFESEPRVDLVFMDIELGDGRSFDIFEEVEIETPIIFITAYQEHALAAFKKNSIDYLLKPLHRSELEAAIKKFRKFHNKSVSIDKKLLQILKANGPSESTMKKRFLAKLGTRLISIPVENIAYFYTKEKFQYIKTIEDDDLIIDKPLDEIEAELDKELFFRANRQFILNYNNIEKVHAWFSGKLKVQVKPFSYEEIIISRLKATDFKKWLGE